MIFLNENFKDYEKALLDSIREKILFENCEQHCGISSIIEISANMFLYRD